MINRIGVAVILLLLTACSSIKNERTFYQLLLPEQSKETLSFSKKQELIWIEGINVNDMLNDKGIVYQTSDISYVNAKQNLWLTPLANQLTVSLIAALRQQLPTQLISTELLTTPDVIIKADISGFHGRYDGKIIIAGIWTIQKKGHFYIKPFERISEQSTDGYPELVRQLSTLWVQEVLELSYFINK